MSITYVLAQDKEVSGQILEILADQEDPKRLQHTNYQLIKDTSCFLEVDQEPIKIGLFLTRAKKLYKMNVFMSFADISGLKEYFLNGVDHVIIYDDYSMTRIWKRTEYFPKVPCLITNYNDEYTVFPLFNVELRSKFEKQSKNVLLKTFPYELVQMIFVYLERNIGRFCSKQIQ